jgi:hypothetical protein
MFDRSQGIAQVDPELWQAIEAENRLRTQVSQLDEAQRREDDRG